MSLLVKEVQKFCHPKCHYPRFWSDKISCFTTFSNPTTDENQGY